MNTQTIVNRPEADTPRSKVAAKKVRRERKQREWLRVDWQSVLENEREGGDAEMLAQTMWDWS